MIENKGDFRPLHTNIEPTMVGMRLDAFLALNFPFLTRSLWRKKVRLGYLRVRGQIVRPSYRVRETDSFSFFHPQEVEPPVDNGIYPIGKAGSILAVYKPGNLPMHENGPYRKNTFAYLLGEKFGSEWAAVHRLDRETSGIVLCGATSSVRASLSRMLVDCQVQKTYFAIAKGISERRQWDENSPIGDLESSEIRIKKWVNKNGQEALTQFRVLEQSDGFSLLEARPKTGRTNQIRIHAACGGLPLLGDKLYHPDESVFLEYFEKGNTSRVVAETGAERLCLHAGAIEFYHPESGKNVLFESEIPEDMMGIWSEKNTQVEA